MFDFIQADLSAVGFVTLVMMEPYGLLAALSHLSSSTLQPALSLLLPLFTHLFNQAANYYR